MRGQLTGSPAPVNFTAQWNEGGRPISQGLERILEETDHIVNGSDGYSVGSLPRAVGVFLSDLEQHWHLPPGCLQQGRITCQPLDGNRAAWTPWGGILASTDRILAEELAATIAANSGEEDSVLFGHLEDALHEVLPDRSCSLEVGFYATGKSVASERCPTNGVEIISPEEFWPDDDDIPPGIEHVFVIRDGSTVVANAPCRRSQIEDHSFYAVGVGTHPDYRNKGFGKRVVAAAVAHIISQGGTALWNCDARNVASRKVARATGFVPCLHHFSW